MRREKGFNGQVLGNIRSWCHTGLGSSSLSIKQVIEPLLSSEANLGRDGHEGALGRAWRELYWVEGERGFRDGGILDVWTAPQPQVPRRACVSAIPRSVARDAASRGPEATLARATPVSGSARKAHTASVSLAVGVDGGGAGGALPVAS